MSRRAAVISSQTVLMFPLESKAICGLSDAPKLFETFLGVEKGAPPSVERLRKTSKLPGLLSCQTTSMLPLESKAICGEDDLASLKRFFGAEKVTPPSLERLRKTSDWPRLGMISCQTTLMAPLES